MHTIRRAFVAAATLFALAAQAQTAPKVEGVWARPTVAGQSGGGGFLKITGGSTPDRLVSASAGVAKVVELHTMEMDGNVMRMRQIPAIEVPAGETVELKPGGRHIMFMGLTQTLKAGDSFPMTLRFEKAGEVKVDVKVTTMRADAGEQHKH
jgi:periplasmic copper chaperone A